MLASLTGCAQLLGIDDLSSGPDAGPGPGQPDAGDVLPTAPEVRQPMNGSRIRGGVTFAWQVPPSSDLSFVLEYGTDPLLFTGVTRVDTFQQSHRPGTPLPVSATPPVGARYYWRVTTCDRTRCSEPSPIWYFDLDRLRPDLNGDGRDDILIGAPLDSQSAAQGGMIYAYSGALGNGSTTQPDGQVGSFEAGEQLGQSLALADFNGDGFAEMVGGSPLYAQETGRFHFYLGHIDAPGVIFDPITVSGGIPATRFGASLVTGDFNGDGFADLVVGDVGPGPNFDQIGHLTVFRGGFDAEPTVDQILGGGRVGDGFGGTVASAGDVNGDGYEDLVVGVPGDQQALVYFGTPDSPLNDDAPVVLSEPGVLGFGAAVAGAGDVDGDGYHDVLIGAPMSDRVFLYRGGPGAFDTRSDIELSGVQGGSFGATVGSGGDMNGDGRAEIVIAAPGEDMGAVSIYDADRQMLSYIGGLGVSGAMALAEPVDLDLDGFSDVVIAGGPNTGAHVFFGGSFDSPRLLTVQSPTVDDGFGAAIAP